MSFGSPFFEGTEKKVELVVDPALPSFRDRGDAHWAAVARQASAEVLSKAANSACDAYLLSESSLFVFDHKLIMMTCGRTRLDDAVLAMLDEVPSSAVKMFVYERKNEVFPRSQPSSFFEDVRRISERVPGRALKFGHEDEHHLYLFHTESEAPPAPKDMTLEVLMYGLERSVRDEFRLDRHASTAGVRAATGVHEVLPGFEVDDHLFHPSGYSLNALRGETYYTIHVTPERTCSYASFETNRRPDGRLDDVVRRVIEMFRPRAYDLILFDTSDDATPVASPDYRRKLHVEHDVGGYRVRFLNYYRPTVDPEPAIELTVREEGSEASPR